ncbi:MAG TPA: EAL domain-containing protein, partial [Campylobacterales bacterium]|nr:EAL domain-containing protein [Campylobacterales bacterium]
GKIAQDGKNVKRVVGFLTDISDIKTAQLELARSQEEFELFMESLPAAAYIRDMNNIFTFSNKYINNFFGVETLIGKHLSEVFSLKELKKIEKETEILLDEHIVSGETVLVDRFDTHRYFHTNRFLLNRGEQSLIGGIYTDISSQKMTEKKLDKLAHYDLLTNLPNRVLFYNSLTNSISKSKRNSSKVALMFIDLDNFKTINDTLGHDYGDILLKEVADKLKSVLRAEDVVSRLGGDEFTVILDDITDNAYPSVVAQKIIDELSKPIKLKDEMGYIGSSIGIAIYPDDADDMDALIKNADMAMYEVKGAGKNTFKYFTEEMDADSREKMELTNDLRSAVMNNELEMYYQPIVDVQHGGLSVFEALVRWKHPKYGLITPDYFIHLAEEGGFMVKIGKWVLSSVCQKIKKFQDRGYNIKIAANISSKQLTQNHLEQTTKDIIKQTGIKPELLELEVTEGFLMENIEKVEEVLRNLKEFGVGISIDDFGTGYSSLSRLKSLPITKLKIDKIFVDDIVDSESDQKIFNVIISLAKGLGLEVVVEGVETKEQFEFVQAAGCDLVQGYYFSKPLSSARVDKFLEDVMQ